MADQRSSWKTFWGRWKRRSKWLLIGAVVLGVCALVVVIIWPDAGSAPNEYDVFVWTNMPGENQDQTGMDIRTFVNKEFPPSEYDYVGVIAQRHPAGRSQTTTTYVLFRRK